MEGGLGGGAGSPGSSTEGGTPSVHADLPYDVAPAPKVGCPRAVIVHHGGGSCTSWCSPPQNSMAEVLQVRAFPIVGANPGPR